MTDTAAERLEPVEQLGGGERDVVHHPAQVADPELGVDGLVGADDLLELARLPTRVLVPPARFARPAAAPPSRRRRRRVGAAHSPIAPGPHHVVAEELELVLQPLVQLRQVRVVLVVQEVRLQPDDRLALAVHARATGRTSGSRRGSRAPVRLRRPRRSGTAPGRAIAVRPWLRRSAHRVVGAPQPVLERLQHAQVVERPRRLARVAVRDRAVGADETGPASASARSRRTPCRGCSSPPAR